MAKALLLFASLALILASSYSMKCYEGANVDSLAKAKIKDGCGSCLWLNFGVYTYACSPVDCSLMTEYTELRFNCCMDEDLCNSGAGEIRQAVEETTMGEEGKLKKRRRWSNMDRTKRADNKKKKE
ncbi:hypothetical protein LSH36_415g00007 [Paralvinella palmiformis]|uniref:Uncharacterized protein n=1 Tax=Paralvinella palmiformis TaxID=53620 RepID=A0AAD9JBP9_9ANNE|nr:hypothetical protein LSH36_415g00007 [Paralvinella palmiformis]